MYDCEWGGPDCEGAWGKGVSSKQEGRHGEAHFRTHPRLLKEFTKNQTLSSRS